MPEFYYWLKVLFEILSTAFVERSASQVTGLAVIGSKAGPSDVKATHPPNGPARALRYFVVDMVEAPSKFRRECYETVKIQREVTLNQSAIKGRSGVPAILNVKQGIDETDIEGNLSLSEVRQTTTQDKTIKQGTGLE
ncbi:hypothetical protein PPACK8108_LOCUS23868 [Phakopsora pachyrhizi]|uniref:Uncharacterized protein n=1 Tax=Phakopsora pachyrhizi TaxID=170000 RepID=A0AAV0BQP3_PHAPC|nr:hypothetical protein PPACK8108_LOCUS23868 [Phakopsora pachyrhizi]